MVEAYVLITVQPGCEKRIADSLKSFKWVTEVNELYGEWDVIIKVKAQSLEELNGIVSDEIRGTKEVKLTSTMIVAKERE